MHTFLYLLIALMFIKNLVHFFLSYTNNKLLQSFQYSKLDETIKSLFSKERFETMVAYNLEKSNFSQISDLFKMFFLIVLCYPPLPDFFYHFFEESWWQQALFLTSIALINSIWDSVVDFFRKFTIEEKYGFNKSTKGLWVRDFLISSILSVLLLMLMFSGIVCLTAITRYWWLFGFLFCISFMIFLLIISPYIIQPIFNKFVELENSPLKDELMQLAQRSGFDSKGIYVMDGSRRTKHANAYFTGFGKFRRIVLFDTLLKQLNTEEIKAVLAHEIGHYKKRHVLKTIAMIMVLLLLGFVLLFYLSGQTWAYVQLGFDESFVGKIAPLLCFTIFFGEYLLYFINPILCRISRKFEYEADAFSKTVVGDSLSLISALNKMTTESMSNPLPHPYYSGFYYSHPTVRERSVALQK